MLGCSPGIELRAVRPQLCNLRCKRMPDLVHASVSHLTEGYKTAAEEYISIFLSPTFSFLSQDRGGVYSRARRNTFPSFCHQHGPCTCSAWQHGQWTVQPSRNFVVGSCKKMHFYTHKQTHRQRPRTVLLI